MRDIPIKNTGDSLSAAEFNDIPSETENLIKSTGITLSSGDLYQAAKSVANYSGAGDFYADSGAADAYVLSAIGARKTPTQYFDGLRVRFVPANLNTGASTINVAALGVKDIKRQDGSALGGGELDAAEPAEITFDLANDYFVLSGNLNETEIKAIAQKGDYNYAVSSGTGAVYTATLAPAISAYTDGLLFKIYFHTSNTSATPTLNLNGVGALTIVSPSGGPLSIGVFTLASVLTFIYSAGKFYLQSEDHLSNPLTTKAWAFVAANGTIHKSINVTSVTRTGVGAYDVVLAKAFDSVNYSVIISISEHGGTFLGTIGAEIATSTTFSVLVGDSSASPTDKPFSFITVGNLA